MLINYRPISILPALSKIIERIMHIRLVSFFNKYKILSQHQFGFRKERNTEHAIIQLTDYLTDYFDRQESVLGLFLDVSKALTQSIILYS